MLDPNRQQLFEAFARLKVGNLTGPVRDVVALLRGTAEVYALASQLAEAERAAEAEQRRSWALRLEINSYAPRIPELQKELMENAVGFEMSVDDGYPANASIGLYWTKVPARWKSNIVTRSILEFYADPRVTVHMLSRASLGGDHRPYLHSPRSKQSERLDLARGQLALKRAFETANPDVARAAVMLWGRLNKVPAGRLAERLGEEYRAHYPGGWKATK